MNGITYIAIMTRLKVIIAIYGYMGICGYVWLCTGI